MFSVLHISAFRYNSISWLRHAIDEEFVPALFGWVRVRV